MKQTDQQLIYPRYAAPAAVAFIAALVLGVANLIMGDLNHDEGWYLYAALKVADGWLPYRDFAFTQGPILPLVYALFSPVIESCGLVGGRIITWSFGFIAALMAGFAARRLGGQAAGVMTFILIAVNVYQSYFTTVVKTYSLCALFLTLGIYAMARWLTSPGRVNSFSIFLPLAGFMFAAAAGVRVSSGVLLPIVGLWMLWQSNRLGRLSWLWFGLGGATGLLVIFLPLYLVAPEGFKFGMFEYHTLRDGGGGLQALVLKGGFISRLIQAYSIAVLLMTAMIVAKIWRPFSGTNTGYHQSTTFSFIRLLWVFIAIATLVHISAPFPYDDYQSPIFPVLALALSVSWSYALRAWSGLGYTWQAHAVHGDPRSAVWFVWVILLACIASSISSPINQDWMIAGRDRIWWNMKEKPSILQLREVARDIRIAEDSGELLTQDTYLAVEAGLRVPRGWEMGPFSYFPDMPTERALKLRLMNRELLREAIVASPARVAAISGYGFAISSPSVVRVDEEERAELLTVLAEKYQLWKEVPKFGQASTTLNLFYRMNFNSVNSELRTAGEEN